MSMREAFLEAAKNNPGSELAIETKKVLPAIRKDFQHKAQTEALFRKVNFLGYAYFSLVIDRFGAPSARQKLGIDIGEVLSQWQGLQPRLLQMENEERVKALEHLAIGMKLLRDKPHPVYRSIQEAASFIATGGRSFNENTFSQGLDFSSRVFVLSFNGLSGYDRFQTSYFLGLLTSRITTPQPDMLRQTISAVAEVLPLINSRLR